MMTSEANESWPNGGVLSLLRAVAIVIVVVGSIASVAFLLREGQRTPRVLLVLFLIWVLSPFVALAWANVVSKHWSVITRATLYVLTLFLTLGSVAIYGDMVDVAPAGSPNAFVFVAVPPVSWLLMATVVPAAAFISRRLSHRVVGA
jgi:hypothetical protein